MTQDNAAFLTALRERGLYRDAEVLAREVLALWPVLRVAPDLNISATLAPLSQWANVVVNQTGVLISEAERDRLLSLAQRWETVLEQAITAVKDCETMTGVCGCHDWQNAIKTALRALAALRPAGTQEEHSDDDR